ncbi:hypothetical protein [Methylosinus sp. PW1]|uniref:hypothetical protein n=1 Tax=Methylosinus sp. PW1 TaxID=107636 RepID=UPI0018DBA45A|nr:hypothetical protein [Methylosinus sp. PW1]
MATLYYGGSAFSASSSKIDVIAEMRRADEARMAAVLGERERPAPVLTCPAPLPIIETSAFAVVAETFAAGVLIGSAAAASILRRIA